MVLFLEDFCGIEIGSVFQKVDMVFQYRYKILIKSGNVLGIA